MMVVQEIKDHDWANRRASSEDILQNVPLDLILLSGDEAHFHLSGCVNKQNFRYWAPNNPRQTMNDLSIVNELLFGVLLQILGQPFSMKWPSAAPWCMTTTWSTTYVVEKCDVMWKLPHPVLTGGSERQLRKLTFGIDLSDYNVG
ncbi:hypothetical protein AVEN_57131-1 [Araneus ventricosus]|uniref:Uncharacterized protein n=2 Tax=Araneus ventricosus TaxID=182803 RepID=A0A4Y2H909_ARAVE|nr:hypothetical protein AVEN_57131-1 [Araneus ventricosus]